MQYRPMSPNQKAAMILGISLLSLVGIFMAAPIPQALSFHHFADTRSLWGIPNFANVVSNLPFLIIGPWG
jgi:hypothetical protein